MVPRPKTLIAKNNTPTVFLRPSHGWAALNLRDLWQYRELVFFLSWRDIKVRYKQAVLGAAWAVIQPLMMMVVFTFIFSRWANLPSGNLPYPIFNYSGLMPWLLFSSALSRASISLVGSSNLLTKVYFPRLAIPLASVMAAVVDFGFSLLVFFGLMIYYQIPLTVNFLALPLFVLLAVLLAFSISLWLSALNVMYRDVQHMVPFLINIWFYISPIAYGSEIITSPTWQFIYQFNPIVGIIDGVRWTLVGGTFPAISLLITLAFMLVVLIGGLFYFRRMEKIFADMV